MNVLHGYGVAWVKNRDIDQERFGWEPEIPVGSRVRNEIVENRNRGFRFGEVYEGNAVLAETAEESGLPLDVKPSDVDGR